MTATTPTRPHHQPRFAPCHRHCPRWDDVTVGDQTEISAFIDADRTRRIAT